MAVVVGMEAGTEGGMVAGTAGTAVGGMEAGGTAVTGTVGAGGQVTAGVGGVGAVGIPILLGVNTRTVTMMAEVTAAAVAAVAVMAILPAPVMKPQPSSPDSLTSVTIMARSTARSVPEPKALSKLSKPTVA